MPSFRVRIPIVVEPDLDRSSADTPARPAEIVLSVTAARLEDVPGRLEDALDFVLENRDRFELRDPYGY